MSECSHGYQEPVRKEPGEGPRILIFGKRGQVAAELSRYVFPSDVSVLQLGRADCDVTDARVAALAIRHSGADVVINAAGYSAMADVENDRQAARVLNAMAPGGMAKAASELGCPIVHLSSAEVFAGDSAGAYREGDRVGPVSTFGRTKEAGERAVMRANERHIIVRTSWVFGALGEGVVQATLAKTRAGARIEAAELVSCPTPAQALADALARIALAAAGRTAEWGVYHFCGSPPTSRAEFLEAILREADLPQRPRIETAAGEVVNHVLDNSRIKQVFGIDQPDWRAAVRDVVRQAEGKVLEPAH